MGNDTWPCGSTDLVATPISETRVDLSWTDRSPDELGFKIERMVGPNGLFQQIAIVGAGVTTYSDESVNAATNYYYRVRAFDATRISTLQMRTGLLLLARTLHKFL